MKSVPFLDFSLEKEIEDILLRSFGVEKNRFSFEHLSEFFTQFKQEFKANKVKIITIAGTNGKGETSRLVGNFLQKENMSFALWTSPHVLSICERLVFNGKLIDAKLLLQKVKQFQYLAGKLSYYEFLFFIFCHLACQKKAQVLVLETGLGGRLDAVNIFDAHYCALTSVSRDHTEILGNRFDLILKEKLGITRKGGTLVSSVETSYLQEKIKKHCHSLGIDYHQISTCSLNFHQKNYALASKLFELCLKKSAPPFSFSWEFEARFGFVSSHNIDGFRQLAFYLRKEIGRGRSFDYQKIWVSFSKRSHQEINHCLSILSAIDVCKGKIVLTGFTHPKAQERAVLKEIVDARKDTIEFVDDFRDRITFKQNSHFFCGSNYFLGEVKKFLFFTPDNLNSTSLGKVQLQQR